MWVTYSIGNNDRCPHRGTSLVERIRNAFSIRSSSFSHDDDRLFGIPTWRRQWKRWIDLADRTTSPVTTRRPWNVQPITDLAERVARDFIALRHFRRRFVPELGVQRLAIVRDLLHRHRHSLFPRDGVSIRAVTRASTSRFSIAHELGHFVLGHAPDPSQLGGAHAWKRTGTDDNVRDPEREANTFASEILMPRSLVEKRCDVSPVDLTVSWEIAKEFAVSILTSTRRFAELSPERCIAVFSANGVVQWRHPSATFTRDIAPGRRIDRDSAAWDFFAHGKLDDRPQPIPASAWIDTSVDVDIIEHSICSHEHRTVLSLLWVPERVAGPLGMIV